MFRLLEMAVSFHCRHTITAHATAPVGGGVGSDGGNRDTANNQEIFGLTQEGIAIYLLTNNCIIINHQLYYNYVHCPLLQAGHQRVAEDAP